MQNALLQTALLSGLVLSLAMTALLILILKINPEMMLNDYPPDIRARFGPISKTARNQRAVASLVMLVVIVAVMAWSFRRLDAIVGGDITFKHAFVHTLIVFGVFNLVDWLVIDWAFFVRMQPKFAVLPGTEGMAGYRDYAFHFRGFLIGIAIALPMSAVIGAIVARFM